MKNLPCIYVTIAMILACLASVGHAEEKQRFSGQQSGVKKPAQKVIDNLETWKKVWREVHQAVSPKPKLPKVDFEKQVVLAVFMGEKNTGGYRIQIRGMKDTGKKIEVSVKTTSPPQDGFSIQVLTQPYEFLIAEKPAKPVKFVVTAEKQ